MVKDIRYSCESTVLNIRWPTPKHEERLFETQVLSPSVQSKNSELSKKLSFPPRLLRKSTFSVFLWPALQRKTEKNWFSHESGGETQFVLFFRSLIEVRTRALFWPEFWESKQDRLLFPCFVTQCSSEKRQTTVRGQTRSCSSLVFGHNFRPHDQILRLPILQFFLRNG